MKRCPFWVVALCIVPIACETPPSTRLNAPPHGEAQATSDLQGTYVYMQDNALLADMTVSDVHFMPHRAKLTSLGEQRLSRLASLIEAYGGTIRFSSDLGDSPLVQQRVNSIKDFLAEVGIEANAETLCQDIPGGSGMEAREVILINANVGRFKPAKDGGGSAAGAYGDTSGQGTSSNK